MYCIGIILVLVLFLSFVVLLTLMFPTNHDCITALPYYHVKLTNEKCYQF